jgi:hypothetical protein
VQQRVELGDQVRHRVGVQRAAERRLHRLHLVAGRPGRALAEHPATALAIPREPQRPRRGRHCRGHRRIPGDEVHRGSVARPIVGFVDRLRRHCNEPVIVLIPVALPDRLRYRFLHNHVDLVLMKGTQTVLG